ncbi:MBL fold metallo-hydrolase [Aquabacterium sp.]|uniref:MBL fold metallo-hydrolase n=1 Tax=Aquabacterium sp. TaxID=1872578 RepID=UPI003D6D9513
MRIATLPALGLTIALSATALAAHAASLKEAADVLGASTTQSIEYSGTGRWFQFGQAPAPSLPWPPFDVSRYVANIDYVNAAARVQIVRKQQIEAGRNRPLPTEQRADQYVNGNVAWNFAPPPNSAPGTAPVPSLQAAAVEERSAEIWLSPQGFLKAALAHQATSKASKGGAEISFSPDGKHRYVGTLNAKNQLEKVQTWIDNPVLGDTLVEARYSGYKDFNGVQFPTHIVRTQGGHPVLDIQVADVKVNPAVQLPVPTEIASAQAPAITVAVNQLADGVYYLTGGTHHSVAIEQKDHIVVVEGPLNEARSQAVIAKVKETIPGKPIKYLVNTHAHFDHAGGLRTFVAEGATIVTHKDNETYYKKVWAAPHKLNPDSLAESRKTARFETFTGKHVLADKDHPVEIYPIADNSHNDAFALIYLPKEKILIEGDAYTPVAANAPIPTPPNPYSVNLYDNIRKLKLDVEQIAALHGPRVVKLADLRAAIGLQETAAAP